VGDRQTDRQTDDLISLVFIFGKKANNEATKCCNVIPLDKEIKIVGKLRGGMIAAAGRFNISLIFFILKF
jgi:hypothetical protein